MRPYWYIKSNPEASFIHHHMIRERGKQIAGVSFLLIALSLFSYVGGYYFLWSSQEELIASKPRMVKFLDTAPSSAFIPESSVAYQSRRANIPSEVSAASDDSSVVYPTFYLSIPRLGISDAWVTTDVISHKEDIYQVVLLRSLAHYKGTAYPGQSGNVVIYGHSILPIFYNPKNYLSIFSTLDTLEFGDQLFVSWGNDKFTYTVEGIEVVHPSDTRVLRYSNGKTLTLITCVPPGYTTRRLLVFARAI